MTSSFYSEIYNGSLLDKDREQYFWEYWLAKVDYLVVLDTEADRTSEATRTRETFNAAIKEVCDTFNMEKIHEEQQKAIDLFSDGERWL